MFYSFFLAVRTIATGLAPIYISLDCISHQFRSASPCPVAICLAFSMRAPTVYSAPFLAFLSVFSIITTIISSMQVLKPIFNDDIAITWSSPRIFALGCLFTSKASPHPHKLDKGLANQDTHILASSSAFAALAVSDRPSAHIGN